jgi:signal transduction histidine kinase
MGYGKSLVGFLGLDSVRVEKTWADEDIALLKTVGEVFINALERKRSDEALRRHAAELQARNEELDAFAHTAAHDLKAPLGLLTGFAEVLEIDYAALSDKERQRSCHHIAQNARKMGNIIDELLLLAGVRKLDVEIAPVDMASIVAEARQHVSDLVKTHGAEIVLPDAWSPASGHAPWIEEVWANYVSNAIKYGGRPPRVELGADTLPGGMVRFWVRDNGDGLTPEDQARLFTPFARLDQARAKGHGLGLSIVRRIVEKLGGQVGVESDGAPGRGSVFYFTLPGVK